ncbi:UNVERIFIED_CONTAM: Alpha-glucan phosphorylase, H isozyme [Sesamum radiatum]|uniref:Alpha-1,4 glucan phosphorylase n=1 Tax=Sesamum radiatum TaxID=300843 RepID=A0AAW2IT25_SESRA
MAATAETNGSATTKAKISEIPAVAHPLAQKSTEIASNIKYHAEYNHFSPFKFELEQAYYATADSVRDRLIKRHIASLFQVHALSFSAIQHEQWNETYSHYHKVNPKQTYYLSMEYLQGRALTNAVGNLDVQDAYADALKQLGHALEDIVEQEKDAALGNGGLGRLASCFLDSMATLNLPAWGYGLRYRYGLFKQRITKAGQEEIAEEDWLEKFSPWEVVRHDVVFPICAVLYPGDATENGKLLRLKQQFFLCSASLQDIMLDLRRGKVTTMRSCGLNSPPSTIAYTNHTVLPEALEKWSKAVMWKLLPRHMEIIEEIDKRFIAMIKSTRPDLEGKLPGLRVLDNNSQKAIVRMANLCVVSSHTFADNSDFQSEWELAKLASKKRLANYIVQVTGVSIDPNSLFDIQVKRIHEYKRQLLNILGAVYRFKKLKEMSPEDRKRTTPRTIMIGGKAFATYTNAKRIVKLVNDVGAVVNNDPEVNSYLKVVFVPNYNVSVAEMLIPGSELSQHISTAGMEASGTSNMKFALNGCLIIGTLDGANVEIREEFKPDPRFEEAKQFIRSGAFGSYDYNPLESLEGNSGYGRGDYFWLVATLRATWMPKKGWTKLTSK